MFMNEAGGRRLIDFPTEHVCLIELSGLFSFFARKKVLEPFKRITWSNYILFSEYICALAESSE
jgi:hypothetical protein